LLLTTFGPLLLFFDFLAIFLPSLLTLIR